MATAATEAGLLQVHNLGFSYPGPEGRRVVLDDVDFSLRRGEFLALLGRSGSGKSTLLNLIGGLDTPDRGQIIIDTIPMTTLDDRQRTLYRRRQIGFVYQFFNLIPTLTAEENVALIPQLNGCSLERSRTEARAWLAKVGLGSCAGRFPDQLSGGEQQRVAIARALVHHPPLVLADEPTGNLDAGTGREVIALLQTLVSDHGTSLIVASHDRELAAITDRQLVLTDGRLAARDQDASC